MIKSVFVDKVPFSDNIPLFSWLDISPTELCNRARNTNKNKKWQK